MDPREVSLELWDGLHWESPPRSVDGTNAMGRDTSTGGSSLEQGTHSFSGLSPLLEECGVPFSFPEECGIPFLLPEDCDIPLLYSLRNSRGSFPRSLRNLGSFSHVR